jgi:hypothetical protein
MDQTATFAAGDYNKTSGVVSFGADDFDSRVISIPVVADQYEGGLQETFVLRLTNPVGASLGSPSTSTVFISDIPFQQGGIAFSQEVFRGNVLDPKIDFVVKRTGGSQGPVAVYFFTHDGSAFANLDYTPTAVQLSWISGDASDRSPLLLLPSLRSIIPKISYLQIEIINLTLLVLFFVLRFSFTCSLCFYFFPFHLLLFPFISFCS